MVEIITFIKCQLTIFLNKIPIYKLFFVLYITAPVIFLTYFRNKYIKVHDALLAFNLLLIWIVQIIIWNKFIINYYN